MTWDILIWLNDTDEPIRVQSGSSDRAAAENELSELRSTVADALANNVPLVHIEWADLAGKGLSLAPAEVAQMEIVERT